MGAAQGRPGPCAAPASARTDGAAACQVQGATCAAVGRARPRGTIAGVIPWLSGTVPFPAVETALADPNGLLAASPDLTPERLLEAYRHGIFPWYSEGQPVLWWAPDPRMVLYVEEFAPPRSLRKTVRKVPYDLRVDTAFRDVMEHCASAVRPGQYGTWITPAVVDAYVALHAAGFAHSVEAWQDGVLIGGLYGVAIGRMFFGESMFARAPDASKVALTHLVDRLRSNGMPLIDCQQETAHLARFGARPIARAEFASQVSALVHSDPPAGTWSASPTVRPHDEAQ